MPLRFTGWIVIFLTMFIALILMILPLPHWAESFRPEWLLLVILYWVIALPHRVNVGIAWISGLLLDGLQGTLLGENALCFALLAYFAYKMNRQIRLFSLPSQALVIFVFLMINQIMLFWIQGLQGQLVTLKWFLGAGVVSAVIWPWIFIVLTDSIKRYRLY